jgi:ABC-2 type transport system permease protein
MANGAATIEAAAPAAHRAENLSRFGFSIPRMLAVARKEMRSYFAFPLIYIVSGIFLMLAGYYAWSDLNFFVTMSVGKAEIQQFWDLLFNDLRQCMLLTLPFITMRLFAEERKLGTVELLYTYPLRDGEILGGKFIASMMIFLMMLAPTLLYPVYIYHIHSFPLAPMMAGYVGVILMGGAFISCGLFISSLCESQVVAGIGTIVVLMMFYIVNWNEASFDPGTIDVLRMVSIFDQFTSFAKGVIDLYHVTYFIFFAAFFMFLTLRSMEARKWTGRR